jgi:hypothetical protein
MNYPLKFPILPVKRTIKRCRDGSVNRCPEHSGPYDFLSVILQKILKIFRKIHSSDWLVADRAFHWKVWMVINA